jgi:hypothetical protein
MQYRTLSRKKESKPSQRASSAFLNLTHSSDDDETIRV